MNRAELIEWLRTYTPFELEFRGLYQKYRTDVPDAEFRRVLEKYKSDPDFTGTGEFTNIDAAVPRQGLPVILPEVVVFLKHCICALSGFFYNAGNFQLIQYPLQMSGAAVQLIGCFFHTFKGSVLTYVVHVCQHPFFE